LNLRPHGSGSSSEASDDQDESIKTTYDVYGHLFKDRREDLARRLDEVHADAAKGHLRAVPDQ
jgi:hypothetical protein